MLAIYAALGLLGEGEAPVTPTLDLALAKKHLRVLHDDEDTEIQAYLNAAINWVEQYTGQLLTRREVEQEANRFSAHMPLFYGPKPASLSIDYIDADSAPQTITDAMIVRDRIYPATNWPTIATNTPITLTYTAGYSLIPDALGMAVLLLVGHYYKNREAITVTNTNPSELPLAVESLCRPYRAAFV